MHTLWFYIYLVQKEAKLIYGVGSQDRQWLEDSMTESLDGNVLFLDLGSGYTGVFRLWKFTELYTLRDFSAGTSGKEPTCQCRRCKRWEFDPWVRKSPWRRAWQSTPVFLPGKSHGQKSLAGYSPWDQKESDMIEHAYSMHVPVYQAGVRVPPGRTWRIESPTSVKAGNIWAFLSACPNVGQKRKRRMRLRSHH